MANMTIDRAPVNPVPSRYEMPDPGASEPGIDVVAIGADLAPGTLLAAYRSGMFPMPVDPSHPGGEIAWYSPDPRGVLPLDGLRVSKSLRRSRRRYRVTKDHAFGDVMQACADPERDGHWITTDFVDAYSTLFDLGWAHSYEAWDGDRLVGGLYGLRIGGLFAGEAMFHRATDASKVVLVELVDWLNASGATLLDVQWATPHLASLGVIEMPRVDYLRLLRSAVGDG